MTHSTASSDSSYFVGIDVAKTKLDLARSDRGEIHTVANDPDGIRKLVESLVAAPPQTIVIESTGGLERPLLDALLEANLSVALVNPGNIRHFARGMQILAKSDPIDARVLVEYARLASPRLAEKRSAQQAELDALLTCRRQLTRQKAAQLNCRATTSSKTALRTIDNVLKTLKREIDRLDKKIRQLIESDDDLDSLDKLLRTAPGIGPVASATLVTELSELGETTRRSIGALVGVAPYDRDSGMMKAKRSIFGGRASVRSVLYMATITAIRCNPVIKIFAQRLEKMGKTEKVKIIACMRKMLSLLNAMVRDGLTWDQLNVVKALAN
jgi:transposase